MDPNTGNLYHDLPAEAFGVFDSEDSQDADRIRIENSRMARMYSIENSLVEVSEGEANMLKDLDPRDRKGWMRNQQCPCGSGKKFKRCCWGKFAHKKVREEIE